MGGKVLTLDSLQRRGFQLPNRCFLCECEEESVNHILIYCTVVRALWDIVFGLVDVKWVSPGTVKEVLASWRGSCVGKKRKKIWDAIPLCIFWTVVNSRGDVLQCSHYVPIVSPDGKPLPCVIYCHGNRFHVDISELSTVQNMVLVAVEKRALSSSWFHQSTANCASNLTETELMHPFGPSCGTQF
ncbi:hypothetical protein CK203_075274 [Vitis vinifera]|uniref:Reverse transcriptase zinc-binding domain-containing protein n=1 Tax=Vitis vinifera TaxID=29760 RepID=A0A438F664_VITVI|nr:hypothetical protein CK203_075274 [Vitis vinifera]